MVKWLFSKSSKYRVCTAEGLCRLPRRLLPTKLIEGSVYEKCASREQLQCCIRRSVVATWLVGLAGWGFTGLTQAFA